MAFIPYQAIASRFAGPTNYRGARLIVSAEAGRKVYAWDYAANVETNHARAAEEYARHMEWDGAWYGGGTAEGYTFVRVPGEGPHTGAAFVIPACAKCGRALDPSNRCRVCDKVGTIHVADGSRDGFTMCGERTSGNALGTFQDSTCFYCVQRDKPKP